MKKVNVKRNDRSDSEEDDNFVVIGNPLLSLEEGKLLLCKSH